MLYVYLYTWHVQNRIFYKYFKTEKSHSHQQIDLTKKGFRPHISIISKSSDQNIQYYVKELSYNESFEDKLRAPYFKGRIYYCDHETHSFYSLKFTQGMYFFSLSKMYI